jgi:20S proteasome alpha/beta subunit
MHGVYYHVPYSNVKFGQGPSSSFLFTSCCSQLTTAGMSLVTRIFGPKKEEDRGGAPDLYYCSPNGTWNSWNAALTGEMRTKFSL